MNVIAIILVTVALICGQAEPEITPQYNYTIWQNQLETFQTIARRQDEVIKNQTEMINDLGKRMDQLMNNLTVISTDTKKYLKGSNDYLKMENNQLRVQMNKSMADMKESSDNTLQNLRNQNWYLHKVIEDMEAKENVRNKPADCAAMCERQSGVYTIYIGCGNKKEVQVRCHMDDTGGWTVIQQRFDGSVSFAQNWASYKSGFGTPDGEYWIGNDNLHLLTSSKTYQLLVELTAHNGSKATAMYDSFKVAGASDNYRMTLGTFLAGTAGDGLTCNNGKEFSTYDNDNDNDHWSGFISCSKSYGGRGGWWYCHCGDTNINGGVYHYAPRYNTGRDSLHWKGCKYNALKASMMAIRPKNF